MKYHTIVADPPWEYPQGVALGPGHGQLRAAQPLPYPSMTVETICEMPISDFAATDCRLFLWATNSRIEDAFDVLRAWRFKYRQLLVWHKTDVNIQGSVAPNSAEFVLVGVRGVPVRLTCLPSAVIAATRVGGHSTKRELWLDYFEQVSPPPRIELFARRQRLGWDTWGNEAFEHVEMAT